MIEKILNSLFRKIFSTNSEIKKPVCNKTIYLYPSASYSTASGGTDNKWLNVHENFINYRQGEPTAESAIKFLETAKEFHADCQKVQKELTVS